MANTFDAYHKLAKYYDELQSFEDLCSLMDDVLSEISHYSNFDLASAKRLSVADLGCGTGIFSLALIKKGYLVTAVDLSERMLDVVKEKYDLLVSEDPNFEKSLKIIKADLTELIFAEQQDVLLAMTDTLNHIDDNQLVKAFKTASENLTSGGLFIFDLMKRSFFAEERGDQTFFAELGNDDQELHYDSVHPEMSMIWENEWVPEENIAISDFVFFEKMKDKDFYKRTTERVVEYYHDLETIESYWLEDFSCQKNFDYPERKLFVLKKF